MPSLRAPLAAGLALALVLVFFARGGPPAEAATINVTTTADDLANNGNCSLREAIRAANTNLAVDACPAGGPTTDTINLQSGGLYVITLAGAEDAALTGDLDITSYVAIVGNGATIDGNGLDRVFDMAGLAITNVSMSNLTVRNGHPAGGGGGGIRVGNSDSLSLTNVVLADNTADLGGGGISSAGMVTLTDVTIRSNHAASVGGGVQNATAVSRLTATKTTISANDSMGSGGAGLYNESSAQATLTNVTVSGNSALGASSGGGIHNRTGGTVNLTNVTVAGNYSGSFGGYGGGGIRNNGVVNLKNTILAGNASISGPDCSGTMSSQGHNLVQNPTGCTIGSPGDIFWQDPGLGLLWNNGGVTETHALPSNSPAVNTGDNVGCPATDQRSVQRPQGPACDIGAYEYPSAPVPTPTPTPTPSPTPVPTPTPSPTPTSPPPSGGTAGNVDCSGGGNPVDAVDGLKILRWVAGLTISQNEPCTNPGDAMTSGGNPYIQGDVDCSGAVTAVDALKILRWLAGLPISLPQGCPALESQV